MWGLITLPPFAMGGEDDNAEVQEVPGGDVSRARARYAGRVSGPFLCVRQLRPAGRSRELRAAHAFVRGRRVRSISLGKGRIDRTAGGDYDNLALAKGVCHRERRCSYERTHSSGQCRPAGDGCCLAAVGLPLGAESFSVSSLGGASWCAVAEQRHTSTLGYGTQPAKVRGVDLATTEVPN